MSHKINHNEANIKHTNLPKHLDEHFGIDKKTAMSAVEAMKSNGDFAVKKGNVSVNLDKKDSAKGLTEENGDTLYMGGHHVRIEDNGKFDVAIIKSRSGDTRDDDLYTVRGWKKK